LTPVDDDCDGQTNEEGALCICLPGTMESCYSGPPGTVGVGICVAGTKTCSSSGAAWGPCVGAVTPVVEDCQTPFDDDCDGSVQCDAPLLFARPLGGVSEEAFFDVAADHDGNLYVTGDFTGTVDFGVGSLASAGGKDIFLLKLDPGGNPIWSERFGTAGYESGTAIAADEFGDIVLVGRFHYINFSTEPVDFGLGPLLASPILTLGIGSFAVKFDDQGNAIWDYALVWPYGGDEPPLDAALDSSGNPHVLRSGGLWGYYDYVWTKLDGGTGASSWEQSLTMHNNMNSTGGIGVDSAGNVLVGMGLTWNVGELHFLQVVLKKRDPAGNVVWDLEFGGQIPSKGGTPWALAVDAADNLVVAGRHRPGLDFGGGPLPGSGMFLVKLDPAGNHVWSKSIPIGNGSTGTSHLKAMAMGGASHFVMTGMQSQTVDFGGGSILGSSFLVKFDPDGEHVWSKSLSGVIPAGVTVDGAGRTIVVGTFSGTIDLGGGPITASGGNDGILAVFGP
jgi:hypothetical protein